MDIQLAKFYDEYGFPSFAKFYQILKEKKVAVTQKEVKEFLARQEEEQLFKQPKAKKQNRAIVSFKENEKWQIDLLDYSKYAPFNKNFEWIFVAVDIFTRKAYAEPMKSKSPNDTVVAFKKIIAKAGKPYVIMSDNGTEWLGKFKEYCEEHDINQVLTLIDPDYKNADHDSLGIIDRFAQTIGKKLLLRIRKSGGNWVDFLQSAIEAYNNSPHRGIMNRLPNDIAVEDPAIQTLNVEKKKANPVVKIKVGDIVRVFTTKQFAKGFDVKYSQQLYTVTQIVGGRVQLDNGSFYAVGNVKKVVPIETKPEKEEIREVEVLRKVNKEVKPLTGEKLTPEGRKALVAKPKDQRALKPVSKEMPEAPAKVRKEAPEQKLVVVEKILKHGFKPKKRIGSNLQLLTKYKGVKEPSWQPFSNFVNYGVVTKVVQHYIDESGLADVVRRIVERSASSVGA
jgi:hypothetical protein